MGKWLWLGWLGSLAALAGGIAFWQYQEYQHETQLARSALERQAELLCQAVLGGIRSHRRLGRFFELQLQAAFQELVQSPDIFAVGIYTPTGRPLLVAGSNQYLEPLPSQPGFTWKPEALVCICSFNLPAASAPGSPGGGGPWWHVPWKPGSQSPKSGGPWWAEEENSQEGGFGGPGGRGAKTGLGRQRWSQTPSSSERLLAAGGQFLAVLVLDRSATDAVVGRAVRLRMGLAGAGIGVIFLAAIAGWFAWRLLQTHTRTQLLEMEARHLRDLSQAAAGLAHQTRHPLALLRGWAQRLAQSEWQSDEARQRAQALMEECDRLTARLNQFLAFARPRDPEPEPVSVTELIQQLELLLQPDWEAKQLRLRYHPPPDCRDRVEADRDMLRQALFNLLQNAIQASPEGGEIEIRLQRGHDGRCRLSVADQGPGVPEEDRPKLFTPYFSTREGGSGLGLAIVRRIATAHGWQVGYQSRPEGGSLFWIAGLRLC